MSTITRNSSDTNDKPSVLVVLATGKMGFGCCKAFLDSGRYNVYGTSRDPNIRKLLEVGVTPIEFRFGDQRSMEDALKVSNASVAVIITDLITIAKKSPENELQHGRAMIDACKKVGTKHVILCSNCSAEVSPDICAAKNMTNKLGLEKYLKSSGLASYSILRPVSFMENYDDAINYNPLTRGYLSDLYPGNTRVALVATLDIGKAAVAMADDCDRWNGKALDCASCIASGDDNAKVLSHVSGVPCIYRQAPPGFILWFISRDLYKMVQYVSDGIKGTNVEESIKEFRKVVPDAVDMNEWFAAKGVWADGTVFGEIPAKGKKSNSFNSVQTLKILVPAAAVVAAAVALRFISYPRN